MFNCSKKFFVIFLLFSFSSMCAMENTNPFNGLIGFAVTATPAVVGLCRQMHHQNILDAELWNEIRAAHRNNPEQYSSADLATIENCLDKGADLNAKSNAGFTLLSLAVRHRNPGFMELLIKRGVDVNHKNSFWSAYYTPLHVAVSYSTKNEVKLLCNAGAFLTDSVKYPWAFGNIFNHTFVAEKIIALITHARFNEYPTITEQTELNTVICELGKWGKKYKEGNKEYIITLPEEIQNQIISYLPFEYFQDPDSEICHKLLYSGYKNPLIFAHMNKRVSYIKQLLQQRSLFRGTAVERHSQWLPRRFDEQETEQFKMLVDGRELANQYRKFSKGFPDILESDPNNWLSIMYDNCARLEIKK